MTQPSPSLLDAIAEVCAWHSRVEMLHPMRTLPSGRREPILPTEIPQAIRRGEIEVPEELRTMIFKAIVGNQTLVTLPDSWHTDGS